MSATLGWKTCGDCRRPLHRFEYEAGRCAPCLDTSARREFEAKAELERARVYFAAKMAKDEGRS